MKKATAILIVLLTVCFTAQVFATGSSQSQTQTPAGPVTIELWYGPAMSEQPPPPADWKVLQLIKDKLDINLVLNALPSSQSDQDTKVNAAAAANNLPELFMVGLTPFKNLVRMGVVAPVDDLYKLMPTRTKQMYDADSIAFSTVNGKSYGFATPGSIIKNEGVLIRKDWLDKLGLRVPVTTEDYFNVMKAFTERDPDGNGRNDTYGYGAFIEIGTIAEGLGQRFEPILGAFGVNGTWNLTKADAGLNVRKPAYFDALTYVKRMVDEKVIDPNWLSYSKDDFRAAWKQGRFGIMREQNAAYAAKGNYDPFDNNFPNGEWMVIDPPKGPTGKSSVGVYTQGYRIYSVSKKAADAGKGPAIAKLLEWMSSDEGYYLLGWGERGVNYVIGPDGAPTSTGIPDPSKGWDQPGVTSITQLRNMVFYNGEMELIARYPTWNAPKSNREMSALKVLFDMQSRPWTPNIGGDNLVQPSADLQRFYEQGVVEFVTSTGGRQLTQANWTAWLAQFDQRGGLQWERDGIADATAKDLIK
jgi:putative aldouronate transport system substrate-binding protein